MDDQMRMVPDGKFGVIVVQQAPAFFRADLPPHGALFPFLRSKQLRPAGGVQTRARTRTRILNDISISRFVEYGYYMVLRGPGPAPRPTCPRQQVGKCRSGTDAPAAVPPVGSQK